MAGCNSSIKISIMQPKFTLNTRRNVWTRILAFALVFLVSTQLSFSQEVTKQLTKQELQQQLQAASLLQQKSNDAGVPDATTTLPAAQRITTASTNRTAVVCQTVNGTLAAGDNTMNVRPFRDGVLPAGCTNKLTCPGAPIAAAGSFYDVITFTNTQGSSQC